MRRPEEEAFPDEKVKVADKPKAAPAKVAPQKEKPIAVAAQ